MELTIDEYLSENNVVDICLTNHRNTQILTHKIYLNYLYLECSTIVQKIIQSGKSISVEVYWRLDSYKNIYILSHANEIVLYEGFTSENIIDIIHHYVDLRKLTLPSSYISKIDVKNKLCEKEFLKYIKILLSMDVNLDDIYETMEIKSLNTLYLYECFFDNYLNSEKMFKILCYIVNTLNKNIEIVIDWFRDSKNFMKYISLTRYNFKINDNNYIFTYITKGFRKFDNLYDFNLYYQ